MRLLAFALLAGCYSDGPYTVMLCDEAATPVAWDDASLGFTADEALAVVGSPFDLDITWGVAQDATTLRVELAPDTTLLPLVVTRTDAFGIGCAGDGTGQPAGTYLRIPLRLSLSDPEGGLDFGPSGPMTGYAFPLDAAAATEGALWFDWVYWRQEDLDATFSGAWLERAEACAEHLSLGEEYEITDTLVTFRGTPLVGRAGVQVFLTTPGFGAGGMCWSGGWDEGGAD
ncbi:MAG: hypothetical protein ABIO70_01400 [Pseudomonadota bacterium]